MFSSWERDLTPPLSKRTTAVEVKGHQVTTLDGKVTLRGTAQ